MEKKIIILGSFLFLTMLAEDRLQGYAHIDLGLNFIGLKNKVFRQSPNYRGQFKYNGTVSFPSLSLDMGFMSGKTFRFLRHDNNLICGLKVSASSTVKKITGELFLEDNNRIDLGFITSEFEVRHDFNIMSFSPYVGMVMNREQYRYGLTAGATIFRDMLDRLQAHEMSLIGGYSGIHLRPRDKAFGGTLRVFADRHSERFSAGISYEYTRATQEYGRHVFIERSGNQVQNHLTTLHLLDGANEIDISEAPILRIGIHTFSLCIGVKV
jgi:hypothetical protein